MNKYTDNPSQDDEFALNFLVKCVISLQARVADLDPGVMVGSRLGSVCSESGFQNMVVSSPFFIAFILFNLHS